MAARRRRRSGGGPRRKKQNVEWANASVVTPVPLTVATQYVELVPDAMAGLTLAPDFLLKRIVGSIMVTPQSAATATSTMGLQIFRSVHGVTGVRETVIAPLSTDVDAGSQDILWQRQLQPQFGGALDATGLDLSFEITLDLHARSSLRRLDKRHGIFLAHSAETAARLEITFRLRILGALSI